MPVVGGAATGVLLILLIPVGLTSSLERCVRALRRATVRSCARSREAVLRLFRSRRPPTPSAWVTLYKTTCRQFSRLTP